MSNMPNQNPNTNQNSAPNFVPLLGLAGNSHYVDFNTQKFPKYKLKKYLYFTEKSDEEFNLKFYNRISSWKSQNMLSKNYLTVKPPSEKPETKKIDYSPFFKDSEVYGPRKEYRGSYSNQMDYKIFKMKLAQEGVSS